MLRYLVLMLLQMEIEEDTATISLQDIRAFLSSNVIDIKFINVAAGQDHQTQQQEVDLNHWDRIFALEFSSFDPRFCKAIAAWIPNLLELSLNSCNLQGLGSELVCSAFCQLVTLNLSGNTIREAGGLSIAKHLSRLQSLNLEDNKIGDLAVSSLVRSLKDLTVLNLINNKVGIVGVSKIVSNCKKLKQLYLGWNNITEDGALKLSNMRQLEVLDIKTNFIGTLGAVYIARGLSDVKFLRIGNNKVGDYGTKIVCNSCSKVQKLGLWDSCLTSNIVPQIAKLQQLTWLTIAHNMLSEADIMELCLSLRCLEYFDVSKIDISEQTKQEMRKVLPDCEIQFTSSV